MSGVQPSAAPATVSGEPLPLATGTSVPGRRRRGDDPRARRPAWARL